MVQMDEVKIGESLCKVEQCERKIEQINQSVERDATLWQKFGAKALASIIATNGGNA